MTQTRSTSQDKHPAGWQKRRLDEIVDIYVGSTQVTERNLALSDTDTVNRANDEFIPLILSGDIKNEKKITVRRYASMERIKSMGLVNQVLRQDRVLLAKSRLGTAGRVATFRGAAIHNGATVSIIPKESAHVLVDFLFYYLQSVEPYVTDELINFGKTSITTAHLKKVSVLVPSEEIQQWIVQQLDREAEELRLIREQLETTRSSIEQLALINEANMLNQSSSFLDREKIEQQKQLNSTLQAAIDKLLQTESSVIRRMFQE